MTENTVEISIQDAEWLYCLAVHALLRLRVERPDLDFSERQGMLDRVAHAIAHVAAPGSGMLLMDPLLIEAALGGSNKAS